jgi:hypothetical protein
MFRTIMLEIGAAPAAKEHAFGVEQAGASDFPELSPAGLASLARQTDIAIAATIATIPPEPAI